jgi:hypothetical protein
MTGIVGVAATVGVLSTAEGIVGRAPLGAVPHAAVVNAAATANKLTLDNSLRFTLRLSRRDPRLARRLPYASPIAPGLRHRTGACRLSRNAQTRQIPISSTRRCLSASCVHLRNPYRLWLRFNPICAYL